jgi:uncharacterized membrane protein YcaP (DUF421 family)
MNTFWNSSQTLLGLGIHPKDLTFVQISLRGIMVFLVALATVRVGLSRAINGSAAFFPTLGGGVVLVLIHRLFAFLAFYSHGFGILVKGRPDIIVRNGRCDLAPMQRNHVFNACSGRRHAS